jgi:hypothetical protein
MRFLARKNMTNMTNPFIGHKVIVRTYSAGVHIGTLVAAEGRECQLSEALRLWSWSNGGLSLSAIANEGMKGGRIDRTKDIFLTEAIEYIPVTETAWVSYEQFIE